MTVDIVLLIILALFTLSGFVSGLIRSVGNLVGFVAGIIIANWAIIYLRESTSLISGPITALVAFFIIATLISFLVGWLVDLIEGLRQILSIIPFLSSINRLLGALFGFVEGILIIAAIAFVSTRYIPEGELQASILDSKVISALDVIAPLFTKFFSIFLF